MSSARQNRIRVLDMNSPEFL